ncbi:type I glyceraldehyde-3-phosphate dehydrogenase [Candidatus Roizmanbacteria bacterium CG22_combo_CG10-13_8_21_14_all_33_16]|uniref:Type I glyceraldehyde-3-phosphate dehydrogenase n=1 Tax=Candidatus Roizmanbacteria bacterium CG22_combo_CG10-13_8_21_14_all_33_16 TaxID=1974859 RepID=A0A2H0C651_9BACT|nr:MAG: type I glyceraldehyde-3-phosphate dehydrogenase [Candidatus Roizmanbacteria bacterium CG22_combo_CG10-13_8_21_14_all_33_16]
MKRLKIGLNGFGRIGRAFTRIAISQNQFDIVAINTRKTPVEMMAYLLQYDSVYRKFNKNVSISESALLIDNNKIVTTQNPLPENIPWDNFGVDVVVDATGAFTKKVDLVKHIKGTVKKVLLTAPSKDEETPHVVMGVNEDKIDWQNETVISNASCTTNCAAPLFKVLDDNFKIKSGFLTTSHAYTLTQSLLDDAGKDFERSRAAALNIIPSTTGAAKAVVKTLPHLQGKIDGMAIRVPVPTVSFSDISVIVEKNTTKEEVNQVYKKAQQKNPKIIDYQEQILVSSDYIGSPYSVIFDANYTKVINQNFIKVFSWYDNEWGYSNRLVDLINLLVNYV